MSDDRSPVRPLVSIDNAQMIGAFPFTRKAVTTVFCPIQRTEKYRPKYSRKPSSTMWRYVPLIPRVRSTV